MSSENSISHSLRISTTYCRYTNKCLVAQQKTTTVNSYNIRNGPFVRIPRRLQGKHVMRTSQPSFSADEGRKHFKEEENDANSKYDTSDSPGLPEWVHRVMPPPETLELYCRPISSHPRLHLENFKEEIIQLGIRR